MSEFDKFLQNTGLTFEEYKEWFLSLRKGDKVCRYNLSFPFAVLEVSLIGIRFEIDFGFYRLGENDVLYFLSSSDFLKAEYFPIPSKEQIESMKRERQSGLWLEVGEIYEDGNGLEWTVEATDLPSTTFNVFTCKCFRLNGLLLQHRLYTRDGKYIYKPTPLDLVSKKGIAKMPIEKTVSPPLAVGQVWQMSDDQEMTVVEKDAKDNTFLLVNNKKGHWFYSDGTKFVGRGREDLHVAKYLRETSRPRLEVGKRYYDQDGYVVGIKRQDSIDFIGTNNVVYCQFGFPISPGNKSIVSEVRECIGENISLSIGECYKTRHGEVLEIKFRNVNGLYICIDSDGYSWAYTQDGKLEPDTAGGNYDLVALYNPFSRENNNKTDPKEEKTMPTELEKEELSITSEITKLFESCQEKAKKFAKACDDEKYRLATENDALRLATEHLSKQLKDLEAKCKDRENRVSFLCAALKDEQENSAREHAHHMETCSLKDEIEEENSKLAEENKQLKQKLDQLKSFLEPDHK